MTVKLGELTVTAKAGKDFRSAMGARASSGVNAARCHLFDANAEARIA